MNNCDSIGLSLRQNNKKLQLATEIKASYYIYLILT